MRLSFIPALAVMLFFAGCGGEEQQTSGTITLSNELYEGGSYYYAMGFSFSEAKEVPTLPDAYRADIKLIAGAVTDGGPVVAFLSANTLNPPFALTGTYPSEGTAKSAFSTLTSVGSQTWTDLAAPLEANQVWVIKTRDGTYAKLRIISVALNNAVSPPEATCTLEWVWQPDGSATFPGK